MKTKADILHAREKSAPTIAERLDACRNRPAGFDYLRLVLATLVVVSHVTNLSYGELAARIDWSGPMRPLLAAILPMFFALSGFLVAGSLERCRTLFGFLGLRVIRLAPALMVDTLVAGLLVGPLFTELPLVDYFAHPVFWSYWTNLVGHVQFFLPGVFADHPSPHVNGQLWTLPWELACYACLTAGWILGLIRLRLFMLFVGLFVGTINAYYWFNLGLPADPYQAPGLLLATFLIGVSFYQWRKEIQLRTSTLIACLILSILLFSSSYGALLAFLPATYVTVHLGMMNPPRHSLVASGDYSYGIYLYAYPLQQAVIGVMGPTPAWLAFLISLPLITALATFSWWCVEKPALTGLRPTLHRIEGRWLTLRAAMASLFASAKTPA